MACEPCLKSRVPSASKLGCGAALRSTSRVSAVLMDVYVSRSIRDLVATSSTGGELGQPFLRNRPCDEEVVRPDAT